MSHDFNVTGELVVPRVDDSHFSVVLSRVLAAVADVHKLGLRFVNHAVRSRFKVDRIEKFERVASKYSDHPVIPACHEQLIKFRNVQDPLRLLEAGNAAHPLTALYIDHLQRAILQPRNEQALTLDIHIHMVKAAFDIRHGNRLRESKRLLRSLLRTSGFTAPNYE